MMRGSGRSGRAARHFAHLFVGMRDETKVDYFGDFRYVRDESQHGIHSPSGARF